MKKIIINEFMKLILKNWIKGCYNHIKSLNKSYNKYIYSIQVLYFFNYKLKNYIDINEFQENEKNIINYFREIKKKELKFQ